MERENKNSNKVLLTVIGAATLITAMVGATFAYFSATDKSGTKTITTANSNFTVTASNNTVTGIRPTSWTPAETMTIAEDETNDDITKTNAEIVRMKVTVTGSSTTSGSYNLKLNQPKITVETEENQGDATDFVWAAYKSDGTKIVGQTPMTTEASTPTIIDNVAYSKTDGTNFTDVYYVYVWLNNNGSQNNLQKVNFQLSFTVTGQNN